MIEEIDNKIQQIQQQIDQCFRKILSTKDPLEYFSKYIAPELYGKQFDKARKAILLSLATQYDSRKRRRIHVLLYGPPGTGKTELLLWLKYKLGAVFVGMHTSRVGLVGDARGSEIMPGALAEAHGNILCIDELDKFSSRDQEGLLQAMEEGEYVIRKGRLKETIKAEVRVIASVNEIDKLSRPLLDRFDFKIELRKPSREERAKAVDIIVDNFFLDEEDESDILREYLEWISDFEPDVEEEEREKIKETIRSYIRSAKTEIDELSYRSLELSILRIAYAYAKLSKSNVTTEHVVKAIMLKNGKF